MNKCAELKKLAAGGVIVRLRHFLTGLEKRKALKSIQTFIGENCFDVDVCRGQLQCLWSAYCLQYGLDVDTSVYDNDLLTLWQKIEDTYNGGAPDTADWSDFDSFDLFMGKYLC